MPGLTREEESSVDRKKSETTFIYFCVLCVCSGLGTGACYKAPGIQTQEPEVSRIHREQNNDLGAILNPFMTHASSAEDTGL